MDKLETLQRRAYDYFDISFPNTLQVSDLSRQDIKDFIRAQMQKAYNLGREQTNKEELIVL